MSHTSIIFFTISSLFTSFTVMNIFTSRFDVLHHCERSQNLDRPFVYLYNSEFPHSGAARTFSTECAVTVQ